MNAGRRAAALALAAWVAATACSQVRPPRPASTPGAQVRACLAARAPAAGERGRERAAWLRAFYERRGGAPAWTGPRGVLGRADELLVALGGADAHGLRGEAYGVVSLRAAVAARRTRPDPGFGPAQAALDVGLTAAFLAYADDLRRGAVDPATVTESWHVRRGTADLSGLLATAIAVNEVGPTLQRLAPQGLEYRRLQEALATALDPERADRLRANLERWRWLPRDLGDRYLLVRIADFELDFVEDGVGATRRVIVGQPFRQTPTFASQITHVIANPPWYVPASIAAEELVPALRADKDHLATLDMEVYDTRADGAARVLPDTVDWGQSGAPVDGRYRFVQRPGPANPLGRVKFVLPNPFAVYLHDTPGTGLFARGARDLSHGCVRVEGAVALARALLQDDPTRLDSFEALLTSGETGRVDLPEPVATYVVYWTASVAPDGQVRFADDLYDADARLLEALDAAVGAGPNRDVPGSPRVGAAVARRR